jgi:hypothetical protein
MVVLVSSATLEVLVYIVTVNSQVRSPTCLYVMFAARWWVAKLNSKRKIRKYIDRNILFIRHIQLSSKLQIICKTNATYKKIEN